MRKFLSVVLIFTLLLMMSTTAVAVAPDTAGVMTRFGEQKAHCDIFCSALIFT